jgi:hypothetical protein
MHSRIYMPSLWFGLVGSHQQERIVDFNFASSPAPGHKRPGAFRSTPAPKSAMCPERLGLNQAAPCEGWGCPPIGRATLHPLVAPFSVGKLYASDLDFVDGELVARASTRTTAWQSNLPAGRVKAPAFGVKLSR